MTHATTIVLRGGDLRLTATPALIARQIHNTTSSKPCTTPPAPRSDSAGDLSHLLAEVPLLAQWVDHETHNNWYPGQILDDDRYTERRVDVLAARARQAWQENMPIAEPRRRRTDSGFAPARIYRKVPRGAHLDVFCVDMRTNQDPNTPGLDQQQTQCSAGSSSTG